MRHILIACLLLFAAPAFAADTKVPPAENPVVQKAPEAAAPTKTAPSTPSAPAEYPSDAEKHFLRSCVGFHAELIPYCQCMFRTLKQTIPFPEFIEMSALPTLSVDPRFVGVVNSCLRTITDNER